MPRQPRIHLSGGLYHTVLRGNHRQAIFAGSSDYLCLEEIVACAVARYGASVFAYCWMTNHVHMAIEVGEAPLGSVMAIIASRYARTKQRSLATTGHLFERRYRARLVDAERYLLALVRYIHLNPVRAGMVIRPSDYRWSSHRAYLGAPAPEWLRTEPVLERFGAPVDAARAAYGRFMGEAPAPSERDELSTMARRGRTGRAVRTAPVSQAREICVKATAQTLEAIAAEVARAHQVTLEDLRSARRHSSLVQARIEIARRAVVAGSANLSQVAHYLNRSPSTLSGLLNDRGQAAAAATEQP